MMATALMVLLAAAPGEKCRPDRQGYCTSKLVIHRLSHAEVTAKLRINTWVGSVVSVEFPPFVSFAGEPAVGNGAYFTVEYFEAKDGVQRLLIRPRIPPGAAASGTPVREFWGTSTNIMVFLTGAPTVDLRVRLGPERTGVAKVRMLFPERKRAVAARDLELARLRANLEAEHVARTAALDEEVRARATETLLGGMLARFECRGLGGRTMRDFLIVRSRQICRIGDRVVLRLGIQNRRRGSVFHLERVEVRASGDREPGRVPDVVVKTAVEDPALAFNEEVELAVSLGAAAPSGALGPWDVEVHEDGGRNRSVVLRKVGF